ncbi:MAG: hypothetical protein C4526_06555 [Nitrospiraceae bacterium]|nr:MAG: hypothetical protein C4526_06555 [Nitrospiraceae bacterium]
MSKWEVFLWLGIIFVFNPVLTYFLFVRRAKVNRKGKVILYSITTMIALFWCGVSTRYFMLSVIAGLYFAGLVIFRNSLLKDIRQGGWEK